MTRVALTWLVWELTESAGALGLLTFAYTGPVIMGGFLASWLLDQFGERRVMLIDSLGHDIYFVPTDGAIAFLTWLYGCNRSHSGRKPNHIKRDGVGGRRK
jgi:MFS family permease